VRVKFDFTIDDLVNGAERAVDRSAVARGWRWQRLVVSCALTAIFAYVVVPGSSENRLFAAIVTAVICAAVMHFSSGGGRKRRLAQYFREQFGGDGPFTCEVELTPAALVTVQRGARSERPWSMIQAIQVTDDSVDFITQGAGSLIVRNRAFSSREQRDAFVSLARSYAPKAALT
jgi:YcxB-like protein